MTLEPTLICSQEGQINLISLPDCCFSIVLSRNTHIDQNGIHIAIQPYIIWLYMAIWKRIRPERMFNLCETYLKRTKNIMTKKKDD